MTRILIVEDEQHMAFGLKFNFEAEGYAVAVADSVPAAQRLIAESAFDLVILDVMLPGTSGYTFCDQLRRANNNLPILMLTARTLSEDKIRAYELGADQYMTKPFELAELLSCVKNLLKRYARLTGQQPPVIEAATESTCEFGRCRVNFDTYEVTVGGEPRKLTHLEMQLLKLFVQNEGRVLTRAELLDKVWGVDSFPTTRTVDNFIVRLRKHFELDASNPQHFLSVRGAGYRFVSKPTDS
jgi:two-component system OmpR family response regulator